MNTYHNYRFQFIFILLFVWVVPVFWGGIASAADGPNVNPRSDLWRSVREGATGYTSVPSDAQAVLIQTEGEIWREIRNGPLASISPWVFGGVLAAIGLFFIVFGMDKLEEPRSGDMLKRYSLGERILHWYTATLFILLAVSGFSLLFGRGALIPLFGHPAFSGYMGVGKWVHNVSGPLFLAGLLIEVVIWIKDNIPKKMDLRWFKNLGGLTGRGPHPHAEKINGGEKAWFWIMVLSGIVMGVTGVVLDFPIWGQSRQLMQTVNVIHIAVAVLFVSASFGHIYIGTIGAEGTFESMWRGKVDAVWAKQHQDLWYEKKMRERSG